MDIFHFEETTHDFKGQSVIVTGGSRGIGLATARAFLEAGAKVAIGSPNLENLAKAQEELEKLGEVLSLILDVRDYKLVENFVGHVIEKFGSIDVLVNNAGIAWSGEFIHQYLESIDNIIDVNVKGVIYMTKAVLPKMMEQHQGKIINVSSGAGKTGVPLIAVYSASKFAELGFTQSLAGEVDELGIKVYAICPGAVTTDMQQEISGEKRGISPEKVAQKILDLASPNPPIEIGNCLEVYW
ncbi:MAG: SDR family oxidoreductase [Patescibacteria group bacterium]|nr:SDR family oxidoreductase [Patescibacteria group bacterium]